MYIYKLKVLKSVAEVKESIRCSIDKACYLNQFLKLKKAWDKYRKTPKIQPKLWNEIKQRMRQVRHVLENEYDTELDI